MNNATLFNQLRVVSDYAVHIVEKDAVVILYNCMRPLLLKGEDKVRLFSQLEKLHNPSICARDPSSLQDEDVLLAARLLQQNILEYVDLERVDESP